MTAPGGSSAATHRVVDAALLLLVLGLTAFTILVLAAPTVAPAIVSDRLDLAIVASASLVAGAVAGLEWARGRVAGDGAALLRGSAFAVLAALNLLTLAVLLLEADAAVGGSLEAPGQLPLIAGILARATCALLLVFSGLPRVRDLAGRAVPAVLLVAPAAAVTLVIIAAGLFQDRLPSIVEPAALARLARDPVPVLPAGAAPILVLAQAAIAIAFLAASVLAHRRFVGSGRLGEALLAAGLIVAAFSQVHAAMHPGTYAGLTTTGDLLRLGFYAVLLAGIVVDRRDDLRELRAANVEVRRLADAELATAALEERARLAREIHDGLAQDLWYAKLKQSRLAQLGHLEGESAQLSAEVESAIDAALAEARHAVTAMREGSGSGSLIDVLGRQVEDYADRFAIRTDFSHDGAHVEVGPRAEAEILRIVQEALTNARRHADATVVRVKLGEEDGVLHIVVSDNGRGFRPTEVAAGFGLDSMRQRARLIGAELLVDSEPSNGTRVELRVPKGGARP
jgi:signal transduction histidine kinase